MSWTLGKVSIQIQRHHIIISNVSLSSLIWTESEELMSFVSSTFKDDFTPAAIDKNQEAHVSVHTLLN